MSEDIIGCSYSYGSALDEDCDEEPKWKIIFPCDDSETRTLISCDHHLADLARGNEELYGALSIGLVELPARGTITGRSEEEAQNDQRERRS